MSKVAMSDLIFGAIVYEVDCFGQVNHLKVLTGLIGDDGYFIAEQNRWKLIKIFVGDRGIRPNNYDNRVTQLFFTEEEALAAYIDWNGQNPNFIMGE